MDENLDAWDLWIFVNTQWRAGGFGIVGLDYGEVRRGARELGIGRMTLPLWVKIQALESVELEKQRDASHA